MDSTDATMTGTRLRLPVKVVMPSVGLTEMSASDNNARSAMGPPALPNGTNTLKHKPSGRESSPSNLTDMQNNTLTLPQQVLESQSKIARQTLAERAGQPYTSKNAAAPPSIRHVNADVKRTVQAGPKSANSFSSTHGQGGRGLPNPGFASSVSANGRPGIGSRAQSAMGHSRSKSQHNTRPESATGLKRTLSQSVRGENPVNAAAAAQPPVNSNGNAPFSSSTPSATVITTFNVTQRNNSLASRGQSRRLRPTSAKSDVSRTRSSSISTTATLVDSDRSVSDPFSISTVSSTGNRVPSLCTRFGNLDLNKAGMSTAGQPACEGTSAADCTANSSVNSNNNDDRFLMPPPPPPKQLKHSSSLPVMSAKKTPFHSPVLQRANTSQRRSPTPQDFSFVTPRKTRCRQSPRKTPKTPRHVFYSKDSLTPLPAWSDETIAQKLKGFDDMMSIMNKQMEGTTFSQQFLKDTVEMQRDQLIEAQTTQKNMGKDIERLREELSDLREENSGLAMVQTELQRNHEIEVDDLERKQRYELENMRDEHRKEVDRLRREAGTEADEVRRVQRLEIDEMGRRHRLEIEEMERKFKEELSEEKDRRMREVNEISVQRDEAISKIATGIGEKEREADAIREELRQRVADFEREKMVRTNLEAKFSDVSANVIELQSANGAMRAKIDFLESDNQQQSNQFADLHQRMQEAIDAAAEANAKLRAEETLRRKLHNQVQELKGNIRVFCRVRPTLGDDEGPAEIGFPDDAEEAKEIVVRGDEKTSALGKVTATNHAFNFDRVFGPGSANADVFDEISQLVQSALDGYNVCIFCYGQTGSGKTFTMSSADGMIPRAVRQIYESATALEEKGWSYKMQGSFVEVYNENINDLLGRAEDLDRKKHEIHHDMKRCKTTITDVEVVELDSPDRVQEVLRTADGNRSVAATKANMRSSRSHSVFILTLVGENRITGERCEGTLNLVDLAGSERLSHSKAEGERLKETQSINKSLSCLGDVIGALGAKGEGGHIPYRNSKLTYLLQFSLGGNSKTLMFVMVSPLQAHLSETLTSLKFATKVHNTHIGTAKRQSKISH